MLAILNSLNAHYFPNFRQILMILVSKFMDDRALFDKTYVSLALLSPLIYGRYIVGYTVGNYVLLLHSRVTVELNF